MLAETCCRNLKFVSQFSGNSISLRKVRIDAALQRSLRVAHELEDFVRGHGLSAYWICLRRHGDMFMDGVGYELWMRKWGHVLRSRNSSILAALNIVANDFRDPTIWGRGQFATKNQGWDQDGGKIFKGRRIVEI
jgi:hypothetical protein